MPDSRSSARQARIAARRRQFSLGIALTVLAAIGVGIGITRLLDDDAADATPGGAHSHSGPTSAPQATPSTSSGTATAQSPAEQRAAALSAAASTARSLVSSLGAQAPGSTVSVAALNTQTGARFSAGAGGNMLRGSISKLDILEAVMLKDQAANQALSGTQLADAQRAMENSDNDAADALFHVVGGRTGLTAGNQQLGLHCTVENPTGQWGLSSTCADDQIVLLNNLVTHQGPLQSSSQAAILTLMRNVESDQRWGVGVVADAGSTFANKDGWLSVDNDQGRWLTNSIGVVTVHGQTVLLAVLDQHNASFQSGIARTEQLARAVAPAVAN